jgi:hypothetical protein
LFTILSQGESSEVAEFPRPTEIEGIDSKLQDPATCRISEQTPFYESNR